MGKKTRTPKGVNEYTEFYNGYDYLRQEGLKELRSDMKKVDGVFLDGSNRKAKTYRNNDGDLILLSYWTEVCKIDKAGNFIKTWNGYSVTTMLHINLFRRANNLSSLSKHEWLEIETA